MKFYTGQKVRIIDGVDSPLGCHFAPEMKPYIGQVLTINFEMKTHTLLEEPDDKYFDHYKLKETSFSWYKDWLQPIEDLPDELFEL